MKLKTLLQELGAAAASVAEHRQRRLDWRAQDVTERSFETTWQHITGEIPKVQQHG